MGRAVRWRDAGAPSWLTWAAVGRAHPDEEVSGDCFVAHGDDAAFVVALVDGLGHGSSAAEAARAAASPFEDADALRAPLTTLMERSHDVARRTRGAALTAVRVRREPLAVESLAVGNVDGVLRGGDARRERIYLAGGVVGYRLPKLRPFATPVNEPLVVALGTDGLDPAFASDPLVDGSLAIERAAGLLFDRYATGTDDALAFLLRVGASP